MADRNDYRGSWSGGGEERRRGEERHGRDLGRGGSERRSFGGGRDEGRYGSARGGHGEGEHEPWRRDRYGSLYDQDRTNYGSGWDRDRGGYGRGSQDRGADTSYDRDRRFQDTGRESWGRGGSRGDERGDYRQTWRASGGAPYGDMELNEGGRGYEEFGAPHDYAYHPHHEFEPDYLHWRDEQLRLHDRDYQEWRREQHRQYDDEYRQFRSDRRSQFGTTFQQWRAQRNQSTGMPAQHIGPETHDYHRRTGAGFGQGQDRPSGALESPGSMTPSPALGQSGGGGGQQAGSQASGGTAADFGHEPSRVQAVTDGSDGRKDHEDRQEGGQDERKH